MERRHLHSGLAVSIGSAALLALSVHLVAASGTADRSGRLVVVQGHPSPPGLFVHGARLIRGESSFRLEAAASAPLVGGSGPVAAQSPDGRIVAYNTWEWTRTIDWSRSFAAQGIQTGDRLGTPQLHLYDLQTQRDRALERSSYSVAWRSDGALAYVRGETASYRANTPYLRDVVVRASPDAPPVAWTSGPDRYQVDGWAGTKLIVERQVPGGAPVILALAAPGSATVLAPGAGFVAISPDGTQVLLQRGPADTATPAVELVNVADGSTAAELPLSAASDPVSRSPLLWVTGPGSWAGDRVVVASSSGLLVLRIGSTSLVVDQVFHLDSATEPNGMLLEPRFTDSSARTIVTWSDVPGSENDPQSVQFECDRLAVRCIRALPVAASDAPRPVYDLNGGGR